MLADFKAVATVAVRDLEIAKNFYRGVLGFALKDERTGVLTFASGSAPFYVYQSDFAGTNRATSITWTVDDAEKIAVSLKQAGVAFEDYGDMPDLVRSGEVYKNEKMAVAWFKDPDGNTLSIVSGG